MNDMTKGRPLRLIFRFALPLLLGNLLQQLYNVADASIVGRFLGANALAAVGATSSVLPLQNKSKGSSSAGSIGQQELSFMERGNLPCDTKTKTKMGFFHARNCGRT